MSYNLKRRILSLFLVLGWFSAPTFVEAQVVGVDLQYLKPTGRLGHIFGPSPGVNIRFTPGTPERKSYDVFYTAGFQLLQPRQDTTLGNYSVGGSLNGNGDVFVEGYSVYKTYKYLTVGSEGHYRPFPEKAFTPIGVISLQAMLGFIDRQIVDGRSNSSESGGDLVASGGLGAGLEYATAGRYSFHFTVIRTYNFSTVELGFAAWRTSLGGNYYF